MPLSIQAFLFTELFSCKGIDAQSHLGYVVVSEIPAWGWQYGVGPMGAGVQVGYLCSGN